MHMKPWAVSLHILCCPWISMYILWQITLSCWTINEYWFKSPFIQGVANAFACTWIRNHWCICCCHCFNLLKIRIAWSKWVGFILTQSFLPNCCFLSISVSPVFYIWHYTLMADLASVTVALEWSAMCSLILCQDFSLLFVLILLQVIFKSWL